MLFLFFRCQSILYPYILTKKKLKVYNYYIYKHVIETSIIKTHVWYRRDLIDVIKI